MVLMRPLVNLAERFPPLNLKANDLQRVFYSLGVPLDARRYVAMVLFFVLLASSLLLVEVSYAALALISAAFVFFLPYMELSSLKQSISSEMPLLLRNVGSLLKLGLPFEKAIEVSTKDGPLEEQFSFLLKHAKKVGFTRALQDFSEKLGDEVTKRAIAQLIAVYGYGGGEELKRLGDELLNAQRYRMKEYGAKSSMLALFFTMFAVIAPTFYVVAASISQSFASQSVSLEEAFFVLNVLSPAISLAIVVASVLFFPNAAFSKKELSLKTLPVAVALAALFYLPLEQDYRLAAFLAVFAFSVYSFLDSFLKQRELEQLERKLADALLIASAMPKGAHMKDIFVAICKERLGKLSEEFCTSAKQISKGMSVEAVLLDMKERVPSKIFSRTIDVLSYAFKSGKNVNEKIAELAEDLLSFMELKREQLSMLSIQKYSLLIGMLLVPFILAATVGIVSSLDVLSADVLGSLRWNIIPAYLVLTSSITALFVTTLEGNKASEMLYFSFLGLISILVFFNFGLSIA